MRFKFFLTKLSILVVVVGCAHTDTTGDSSGVATNRANYNFLVNKVDGNDPNDAAKKVKEYFCSSDGKARRNLTQKIVVKMPRYQTDLETAQKKEAEFSKASQRYARDFFAMAGIPNDSTHYTANAQLIGFENVSFSRFFSVSSMDPKDYDERIKEMDFAKVRFQEEAELRFVSFPKSGLVYIVPAGVYQSLEQSFFDKYGDRPFEHRADNYSKQLEVSYLSSNFTLLGPQATSSKQTSISESVADKERLWANYLSTFTSVKESPSRDGDGGSSFLVTLSLDGFCAYGRPVNQLMAH